METPTAKIERQYRPVEVAALMKRDTRTVRAWLRDPDHPLTGVQIQGQWYIPETHLAKFLNGDFE
jgi:hypothetical protein